MPFCYDRFFIERELKEVEVIHPKNILSALELKNRLPLTDPQKSSILNFRTQIQRILDGQDPRILLIVGPCSIHDIASGLDYAKKLRDFAKEVSDTFFIVMRSYFEKPRTISGWKGLLYDPHLDGTSDIETGLMQSRQFLIQLCDMQLPAATEFLDPCASKYLSDLISWGCIGARTAESQTHRQLASGLPLPISFKNSTTGHIEAAINGCQAAALPNSYLGADEKGILSLIKTAGNTTCHLTLRGGDSKTNYDPESICQALEALKQANLPQRLIVDCSHGNSGREALRQCTVFQSIIHQIIEGNKNIKGMILESHLFSGSQSLPKDPIDLKYGISITDPCIDFDTTKTLIAWAFEKLQKNETLHQTDLKTC